MRPWRLEILALCPEHPKQDQSPKFTPLSETTSIPVCFIWESTPPPPRATWPIRLELIPVSVVLMKQLGVFLLPTRWDAVPPALSSPVYPFIHLGGEICETSFQRTQRNVPGQGSNPEQLNPERSALTMRPTCLPEDYKYITHIKTNYVTWIVVVHESKRAIVYCD